MRAEDLNHQEILELDKLTGRANFSLDRGALSILPAGLPFGTRSPAPISAGRCGQSKGKGRIFDRSKPPGLSSDIEKPSLTWPELRFHKRLTAVARRLAIRMWPALCSFNPYFYKASLLRDFKMAALFTVPKPYLAHKARIGKGILKPSLTRGLIGNRLY